ncbi:MAG: hypothetical protein ACK4YP_08610 [Myxococcota bacterium]
MIPVLAALVACVPPDAAAPEETAAVGDDTGTDGPPEPPEGGVRIMSAALEIPPRSETFLCTYGTWTGGDKGVVSFRSWQSDGMGHHAMFMRIRELDEHEELPEGLERDPPEGVAVPCDWPLENAFQSVGDGRDENGFPAGMAMKLPDGFRYGIQSHYVNTTDETLRAQDAILLGLVPADEVETWASVVGFSHLGFEIPPGGGQVSFECTHDTDLHLLSVQGHMHENGLAWSFTRPTDGGAETVFSIDDWDPTYRDQPLYRVFAPGELTLAAGVPSTTTCVWDNTTEVPMTFPTEMCGTVAVAYPAEEPITCDVGRPPNP